MPDDRPLTILDPDHPLLASFVDVTVADIQQQLRLTGTVIYSLQRFTDLVDAHFGLGYDMPFVLFRATYRAALAKTGALPIQVGRSLVVAMIEEMVEEYGLRGLVGLYAAGNSTKLFLNEPTALVLCRIAFS